MGGIYALIVAAGRGQRAGGGVPKQYRPIAGEPVLRRTAEAFCRHGAIDGVCAAIHPDDRPLYDAAVAGLPMLDPVDGGATRQASVRNGLERLAAEAPDLVLIHDAARPFVASGVIDRVIEGARGGAAIAALPVIDTLKRAEDSAIAQTVDRTGLWRAQTPQGFAFPKILDAHRRAAGGDLSDDAAVAEAAGMTVRVVQGGEANFKITTEDDFARAEAIVNGRPALPRTGIGFDVHAFAEGDHVWLCGVRIPHDRSLSGHSDADVALHALTDALLGAASDGDIGMHFSDKDPQWKGASSDRFLAHALARLAEKGGRLVHFDITIICETPKVGPHREAMLASLAKLTGLPAGTFGLKATTTEKLGFLGRGEGIAAQALATAVFAEAP